MLKRIFVLAAIGSCVAAHASILVTLDFPIQSTNLPPSGTIQVGYTGSVLLDEGWRPTGIFILFPGLTNVGPFLNCTVDPAFSSWTGTANFGDDYFGPLFSVDVQSTDATGFYILNPNGPNGRSAFGVQAQNIFGQNDAATADFGLHVNAVPEPATFGMLGLGLTMLIRPRKSRVRINYHPGGSTPA